MKAARMTSLLTFAVALLTSVVTEDIPDCGIMLGECMLQHLVNNDVMGEDGIIFAINNTHEYCTHHRNFETCMAPYMDRSLCHPHILSMAEYYTFDANFTCTDEASLLAEAARNSVCFNNPGQYDIQTQMASCLFDISNEHVDLCQQTISERECIREGVRAQCGEAYAQFFVELRYRYWYKTLCLDRGENYY